MMEDGYAEGEIARGGSYLAYCRMRLIEAYLEADDNPEAQKAAMRPVLQLIRKEASDPDAMKARQEELRLKYSRKARAEVQDLSSAPAA